MNYFVLFACLAFGGCSTIYTQVAGHDGQADICDPHTGFSSLYSGTQLNVYCLSDNAENLAFFCLVDLPLSLVADTVILPYTLYTYSTGTRYCPRPDPDAE